MQLQRIGALIKEERIKKGMNQADLAKLLHVSVAAVSKWETGKNIPDISNVEKIARILDIPVNELLGISSFSEAAVSGDAASRPVVLSETEKEGGIWPGSETESGQAAAPETSGGEKAGPEYEALNEQAAALKAGKEGETGSGAGNRAARFLEKSRWLWIFLAILAGFCVGGILSWNRQAPLARQEVIVIADSKENTMYGTTECVFLEYTGEMTNEYLNGQGMDFRSEYPMYFKGVDAVLLLYYRHYDETRDDESTADFKVLILN